MESNFKVYKNILSNEIIDKLIHYANTSLNNFQDGKVRNHINLNQKIRQDLFIYDNILLKEIDNIVYDALYENIKQDFCSNIQFREKWKIGHYKSRDGGFYNLHTDDARETKYRKTSMVIALSDPLEYEGGELYFPDLNEEFRLDKGSIIVFKSSLLHGVKPVTNGDRYIIASFMFDNQGKKIKEILDKSLNIQNYIPLLSNIKIDYTHYPDYDLNNTASLKTVIGDIDYSDKYKNPLWTDNDDYYLEDNDGDTLLILFAGIGWKDSIPTFIFYNFLKEYKNIDKLFLRDINCRYYLDGLKYSTRDLNSTIELLKNLTNASQNTSQNTSRNISKRQYKKIVALGCSAGGYAAILYGHLLKFDKVVVFSPQVVLNNKKNELIGDKYNAPKTCEWLTNRNINDVFYQKCLDLKNFLPLDTSIDIHYSQRANNGADKKHALYLESENCKIIEYDSNNHLLALELRDSGELKKIIDDLLFL